MRKKVLSILTLIFSVFMLALSINIGSSALAETTEDPGFTCKDITENFDNVENISVNKTGGEAKINDNWKAYFANEHGIVEVSDDPTDSGMGKVLRLDDSPIGTYLHVAYEGYKEEGSETIKKYNGRNYTISFDAYMENGSDTSWIGVYSRLDKPGKNMEFIKSDFLLMQKGKGVSTDTIITSDGGTRSANNDDEYYQYQPKYSFAMGGLGTMRDEFSNKSKDYGRLYNIDGGSLEKTWLSFKYEVRGNYFYAYAKIKDSAETKHDWQFMGYAYLEDKENKIFDGTIAIGVCGGNYYVDNISLSSEDKNKVTAKAVTGTDETVGKAYTYQETAGDNTDINLIMELNEGYVYGKWYSEDSVAEENLVTPTKLTIQEYKFNEMYLLYEWKDYDEYDLDLKTFADLENPAPCVDDGTKIKEYYTGSKYRLIVTIKSNSVKNDYFATIEKREYNNQFEVLNDDGGSIKIGEELIESPVIRRYPIGETLNLTAVADENKVFAGWYKVIVNDDTEYKIRLSTDTVYNGYKTELGGAKIVAEFVDNSLPQYEITITKEMVKGEEDAVPSGEVYGKIISGNGKYYENQEVSLIAEEQKGFSFYYWEINGERVEGGANYNLTLTENLNVKAVFEIEKYRINIDDGFGGVYTKVVNANSEVRLVANVAPAGYVFSRWIINGIVSSIDPEVERSAVFVASNKNIYAKAVYLPAVYSVKANVENTDYGTIKGKGDYKAGDKVKISVKTKPGYAVAKYTVRGTEVTLDEEGNCTFIMPANDVIIKVQFSVIDKIETNKEIISYAIFGGFIAVMTGCVLFFKKKDDRD